MIINRYAKGGGLSPRIVVTVATGSTVTCTKGGTTLTATGWWLRSAYTYNTSGVWRTTPLGSNTSDHATMVFGVRPAFILPFDTIVSGDGTIQT